MNNIKLFKLFAGILFVLAPFFCLPGAVYASQPGGYEIFIDGFTHGHTSGSEGSGFFYGRWVSMDRAVPSPSVTVVVNGAVYKGTADFADNGLDLAKSSSFRQGVLGPDMGAGTWKSEKITTGGGIAVVSAIASWGGAGSPSATDTRGIDVSLLKNNDSPGAQSGRLVYPEKGNGILRETLEFVKLVSGRESNGGRNGYFHVFDEHSMMKRFSHALKKHGKIVKARHTRSGRELYIQVFSPLMGSAGYSIDISSVSIKRCAGETSAVVEFVSEVKAPGAGMVTASVMECWYLLFAVGIPVEVTDISFEGRMSVEGRGGKRIEMSIPLMTDFRDAPASSL